MYKLSLRIVTSCYNLRSSLIIWNYIIASYISVVEKGPVIVLGGRSARHDDDDDDDDDIIACKMSSALNNPMFYRHFDNLWTLICLYTKKPTHTILPEYPASMRESFLDVIGVTIGASVHSCCLDESLFVLSKMFVLLVYVLPKWVLVG